MYPGGRGRGPYGYQRGRGRGGQFARGGGRGRGRGPRAPAASKKWVRSATQEDSKPTQSNDANEYVSEDSRKPSPDTANAPEAVATKTKVVLKGPKRYPKAPAGSHTWKRPPEEEQKKDGSDESVKETKARLEFVSEVSDEPSNDEVKGESSLKTAATEPVSMLRRGKNKLISQHKKDHKETQEATVEEQTANGDNKVANNKQVGLARKGTNKLVLKGANTRKETDTTWRNIPQYTQQPYSSRGRGQGRRIASGRGGVKRIKLNPSNEDTTAKNDGDEFVDGSDNETKVPTEATEKYTEFAYRGRGTRGGRGARGARNMGLVRVDPDAETTRMCPVYLRGEPCTNPMCTKRHDVPLEAAIPICSFFQRNGMCNKGDECPFRHIKVNPHATICPSFSLLGFCENKACVMKHIRVQSKKSKRGGRRNDIL